MTHIELLAQEIGQLKEDEIDQLAQLLVENSSRRADRLQSSIGWCIFDEEHTSFVEEEADAGN